jgi:hypothetical protein
MMTSEPFGAGASPAREMPHAISIGMMARRIAKFNIRHLLCFYPALVEIIRQDSEQCAHSSDFEITGSIPLLFGLHQAGRPVRSAPNLHDSLYSHMTCPPHRA